MKKFFLLCLFCFFVFSSSVIKAATYTVGSTGCDYASIQAVFDNEDLEPGDIVEIRADIPGGIKIYTEQLSPGSNDVGSEGTPIVVKARSHDSITISGEGNNNALRIYTNYIRFENLTLTGGTVAVVQLWNNIGVEILSCTIRDGGYGIFAQDLSFCKFIGVTIENTSNDGIHIGSTDGFLATGNVIKNISISNVGNRGFLLSSCDFNGSIFSDISVSKCSSSGILIVSDATNVNIANSVSFDNNNTGVYVGDAVAGGTYASFTKCSAYNNLVDGFSANSNGHLTCIRCLSYNNGSSPSSYGDGFTAHNDCALSLYYCYAHGNWDTGIGVNGSAQGIVYNCTFYANGEKKNERNANIWIDSTGAWTIKNTITKCTSPLTRYDIVITTTGASGTYTFDYNCYGDTDRFSYNGSDRTFTQFKSDISGDEHSLNADPRFAPNIPAIKNTSPCIDAGVKLPIHNASWKDFVGNRVRYGTAPDIGCCEAKTWPLGAWGVLPWIGSRYKVQWTPYGE